METGGIVITNSGLKLLNDAIVAGKALEFTTMRIGTGELITIETAKTLTKLINTYKDIGITTITKTESGETNIRGAFTNEEFKTSVNIREVGLFAKIDGVSETLFAYVNDGEGEIYPPGSSGNIVEKARDFIIGITDKVTVTVVLDKKKIYVTIYDLEDAINAHMHDDYRRLIGSRYKGTHEYREYLLGDVYFKDEIISVGAEVSDSSSPGLQNFVEKISERSLKTLNGDVESPFYLNMPHSAPIAGVELENGVRIASENYTVGFSIHKDTRIVTVEIQNSEDPALISSMIEDINSSPQLIEVESLYTPIHDTTEANPTGFVY